MMKNSSITLALLPALASRRTLTATLLVTFLALVGTASASQATVLSATGTGSLTNVNDQISGVFSFQGGGTANYTLTLTAESGLDFPINWQTSTPLLLTFQDSDNNGTDSLVLEFVFSSAVALTWGQTPVSAGSGQNQDASEFTISANAAGIPTIFDPDGQLENTSTGAGTATFGINGAVSNTVDSWRVAFPEAATIYTINWSETTTADVGIEWLSIVGSESTIPEPGTALLLATGLAGLAATGKRKLR